VRRSFTITFWACMSVMLLASLQVFAARTQADTLAGKNSRTVADWRWQPERWKADTWTGPNRWHTCFMNSGLVYTRFAGWNGLNSWGNTEYEQGRDPWKTYGIFSRAVPLTSIQHITVTLRIVEAKVDIFVGVGSAYMDLWVNFSEPVGDKRLTWAELIVYLKTEKGLFFPFQEQGAYCNRICTDGNLTWYLVGYSCFGVESQWSTRTITVNDLISRLAQIYRVDISKGTVSCITFGVEAAQGEIAAEWSYLNYEFEV
jgi:hypothetical protein